MNTEGVATEFHRKAQKNPFAFICAYPRYEVSVNLRAILPLAKLSENGHHEFHVIFSDKRVSGERQYSISHVFRLWTLRIRNDSLEIIITVKGL